MESEMNGLYTIRARVLRAEQCCLLVCDLDAGQQVLVHYPRSCYFTSGDCVCIEYSGMMTRSNPPQVTATNVYHMHRH